MSRDPSAARLEDLLVHADWLRRLATHLARGGDSAEDLVQETWAAALRAPPDPARPARAWLARVLHNFARRQARDDGARRRREEAQADRTALPSADKMLERAEAQRILAELVVALPEPYRSAVLLRYYEGLRAVDIAAAQGVPPGTMRWRLQEGLTRLRAGLDARYQNDRRAWCLALLPITGEVSGPLSTLAGGLLVALKIKLGTLGVVVTLLLTLAAVVGGLLLWRGPGRDGATPGADRRPLATRNPVARSRVVIQAWEQSEGGRPGAVAGVVRDADGRPVPGAVVALVLATSYEDMEDRTALRPRATTLAGNGGAFQFQRVPPGIYLLTATARGWSPAERTDVSLLAGESLQGLELRLGRGGVRIEGRVSDVGGGAIPSPTVRALALGAGGRPEGARTFVGTGDPDGRYELLLRRGSYQLVADADGYGPQTLKLFLDGDRQQDFRLTPAARISGRVVERNGGPVPGAQVQIDSDAVILRPSRAAIIRTTVSDQAGAFVFAGVPGGSYRVSARAGSLTGRAADKVIVTPGGSAAEVLVELVRGLSVGGLVRRSTGAPVAGARVRAGDLPVSATSAADGSYRLSGLSPGRHTLAAEADGFAPGRAPAAIVETDITGVDFVLEGEARVSGWVLTRDRRPLPDASVTALVVAPDAVADRLASAAVGRTDKQGRFTLGGLGPGELRVEAEHPEEGHGVAGPFFLGPAGQREVEVQIGGGSWVRGTVFWDDRSPAASAAVSGHSPRLPSVSTVADAQGRYRIGPFPAGPLEIDARPEIDALERGDSDTEKVLNLTGAEDVDAVDFVLTRRDQEISGVVLDPEGRPLPGATVGVARPYKGVSYRPYNRYAGEADGSDYNILSDGGGEFAVKFLPRGTFDLWATHPEYAEGDTYGVPTGSRGVRLQLLRGASLAGRVVDVAGKPVTRYTVSALLSQKSDSTPQQKAARGYVQATAPVQDGAGVFELQGLHPALYSILVTTADQRGGWLHDIPLAAGERKQQLRVVVGNAVRLKGRVADEATGAPLPGVTVVATLALFVSDVRGRTDDRGAFQIEGVVPGQPISLTLRGDGRTHGVKRLPVNIPAGVPELDAGTLTLPPLGARSPR